MRTFLTGLVALALATTIAFYGWMAVSIAQPYKDARNLFTRTVSTIDEFVGVCATTDSIIASGDLGTFPDGTPFTVESLIATVHEEFGYNCAFVV